MWDAARIWSALDKTFSAVEKTLLRFDSPLKAERIDPELECDGSPISNSRVARHLVWMFEETKKIAAGGDNDKAQRWLGFIQGVAWAKGMTTLAILKDANRDPGPRPSYSVDDLVQCMGEAQDLFRVAKTSPGVQDYTGSALLLKLDGTTHGWEDYRKLRAVDLTPEQAKALELKQRAADLRKMADRKWEQGRKGPANALHDEARALEDQAIALEQKGKNR
jgi:hypothetical protein